MSHLVHGVGEMATYPARYRDANGETSATIENDGATLTLHMRGVTFSGSDFDDLGSLSGCELEWEMPLPVQWGDREVEGTLAAQMVLGMPRNDRRGGIDREALWLTLTVDGVAYASTRGDGFFDSCLTEISKALPEGTILRCCHACAFGDYGFGGHGLSGGLACFRDCKSAYREAAAMTGWQAVVYRNRWLWERRTGFVQEFALCPAWEPRP